MIVIAEKINGTVARVRDAVVDRDASFLAGLAREQEAAGADYIDVNVGTGIGDESEAMVWAVEVVLEATELPLCIDSSDPSALEAGLRACSGRAGFINSVNGTDRSMELILPMAEAYSCPVVALPVDEGGIPPSPAGRLETCSRIFERARDAGIPPEAVFFDPLVLPLSADCGNARVTLDTLLGIKETFAGARTAMGASNVSFGLPRRSLINRALMTVAVYLGLDAALIDPGDRELGAAIHGAAALSGTDRYCRDYMKAFRSGRLGGADA